MLRYLAQVLSVIFHPLLIITYILFVFLLIHPYSFGASSVGERVPLILRIFFSSFAIPVFAVVMMKLLGLVESIELKDKTERIGPYIVTGVFYLWLFRNLVANPSIPELYKVFVLGATIALFLAFFINLFSKISMHAVGMGGFVAMIFIIILRIDYTAFQIDLGGLYIQVTMNTLLMLAIIISGLVGTSRLILNAHDIRDLYGGFLVGLSTQFIALSTLEYFLA